MAHATRVVVPGGARGVAPPRVGVARRRRLRPRAAANDGVVAAESSRSSSSSSSATTLSTAHDSETWRAFVAAVAGEWGGCAVNFDASGTPTDVPLRYVHGVGRVPAANMPFRDAVYSWQTKCEIVDVGDGAEISSKRALPTIGNEDAISSCGGSEWGEDVARVEDEPVVILRGRGEDKTVTKRGAFSAGARRLTFAMDGADAINVVRFCLADESGARVRVSLSVRRKTSDDGWELASAEVWKERKGQCVLDFIGVEEEEEEEGEAFGVGGGEWTIDRDASARFVLSWPTTTPDDDDDANGGSTFAAVAVGEEEEEEEGGGRGEGTLKLPAGGDGDVVWVRVGGGGGGVGDARVAVEAGWIPAGSKRRHVGRRVHDVATGRLEEVSLTTSERRRRG